jgi:hypothetical protein
MLRMGSSLSGRYALGMWYLMSRIDGSWPTNNFKYSVMGLGNRKLGNHRQEFLSLGIMMLLVDGD